MSFVIPEKIGIGKTTRSGIVVWKWSESIGRRLFIH